MEKGTTSSWVIARVVLHLDRLDDLENDESGSISSSSTIHFLGAVQLSLLTLLLT